MESFFLSETCKYLYLVSVASVLMPSSLSLLNIVVTVSVESVLSPYSLSLLSIVVTVECVSYALRACFKLCVMSLTLGWCSLAVEMKRVCLMILHVAAQEGRELLTGPLYVVQLSTIA